MGPYSPHTCTIFIAVCSASRRGRKGTHLSSDEALVVDEEQLEVDLLQRREVLDELGRRFDEREQ